MNGTEVTYRFNNFQGYDPAVDRNVKQRTLRSGSTVWQINSEYEAANSTTTTTEYKSAVVYIALDSSHSLSDSDVAAVRSAMKQFARTLYEKSQNRTAAVTPATTQVSQATPAGEFDLELGSNGITITRYKGKAAAVNIPAAIDGVPVSAIGERAFYGCSALTSITIPSSVTAIEYQAFRGCGSLISITIPNSVTSIGHWAFDGCSSLSAASKEAIRRRFGDEVFRETGR
jgi:hypothetical protein